MSSSERPLQNTPELLGRLVDSGADLVVIGGIAAIAHGSGQFTRDLDITAPFTLENITKLMSVLRPLAPRFYQTLGKPSVTRDDADLATFNNLYFQTDLGIVDILSTVPPVGDFRTVRERATSISLFNRECRVIAIDDLIAVKAFVARPKDKLVEAELRAIRERMDKPLP